MVVFLGGVVLGGGVMFVGGGMGVDAAGWGSAGTGTTTRAGARTVNVVAAWLGLAVAEITSRRWRPGARSWNVSRSGPDRVRR